MGWITVLGTESRLMCVEQQKAGSSVLVPHAGGGQRDGDREGEGRSVGGLRNAEREGTSA